MKPFFKSIRVRIFVVLLAITTVIFVSWNFVFNAYSESIIIGQVQMALETSADLQEMMVDSQVTINMLVLEEFTLRPLLLENIEAFLDGNLTVKQRILDNISPLISSEIFRNVYVLNSDRRLAISAVDVVSEGLTSQAGRIDEVPSFIISDLGDGPRIWLSSPLTYLGRQLGFVVIERDIGSISSIAQSYDCEHVSEETVLGFKNDLGEIVFVSQLKFLANSMVNTTISRSENLPMRYALSGVETTIVGNLDYRGVPVIASTRYCESAGLGLVVKLDVSEAYVPVNNLRFSLFAIGLEMYAAAIVIIYFFTHSISRPLVRLTDETLKVGKGVFDVSALKGGEDELGILQTAFKQMVDNLKLSFEQLNQKNVELAALNKELESFSYSVSHDLRAPLRAIDGFSQILIEDKADKLDEESHDRLRRIRDASQRMGRLIDDMLVLARITRREMSLVDVDLSKVAREAAKELSEADPDRRVRWIIARRIHVIGDEQLLRIMMMNLLSNSWKFTSRKDLAVIEFGESVSNGRRVLHVRDNGVGFDMKYVDKLFTPFQRLHAGTDFPGTGIGLAMVQRVINRHNGSIRAEASVDGGATFYFTVADKTFNNGLSKN